jgi:hypothetical protein
VEEAALDIGADVSAVRLDDQVHDREESNALQM